MKEAFGGNFLFMLVIFFIILFTGYICLSINHTRAFNVKNSLIRIIERNGAGMETIDDLAEDDYFQTEVKEELKEIGYRINGECKEEEGWVGFNEDGTKANNDIAAFCIRRLDSSNNGISKPMYYYEVKTFYHLELPIIRLLFDLSIKGDTKPMI